MGFGEGQRDRHIIRVAAAGNRHWLTVDHGVEDAPHRIEFGYWGKTSGPRNSCRSVSQACSVTSRLESRLDTECRVIVHLHQLVRRLQAAANTTCQTRFPSSGGDQALRIGAAG